MVNLGNFVIDDFSLLTFLLLIIGFSVWYYSRVLKSLSVKVAWESKAGDYRVFKGIWNVNENTVVIIRGRKDKQVLKKVNEPRLFNFSTTKRELWFRAIEGSKKTQPWTTIKDESGSDSFGYEAASLIQYYKERAQSQSTNSLKGQMMGIMIGLGFGMILGITLASLLPQMF